MICLLLAINQTNYGLTLRDPDEKQLAQSGNSYREVRARKELSEQRSDYAHCWRIHIQQIPTSRFIQSAQSRTCEESGGS